MTFNQLLKLYECSEMYCFGKKVFKKNHHAIKVTFYRKVRHCCMNAYLIISDAFKHMQINHAMVQTYQTRKRRKLIFILQTR